MKLGPHRILVFGRDMDDPSLAAIPSDVLKKLTKLFEQEKRGRNRLAMTQAVQLFTFVLTLIFAASLEWFVESALLRRLGILLLLALWVVLAGVAGNRTTAAVRDEFIRFVREQCKDGRPRFCVKCDYDLRGTPEAARCPECGARVPWWDEKPRV